MVDDALSHRLLRERGVRHGFGRRGDAMLPEVRRPRQVHGAVVAALRDDGSLDPESADGVVSATPGVVIAVATADCVPILACSDAGEVVAAIHAGWRGLAAGVVEAGIGALRARAQRDRGSELVAAIGPHIGACCYEVDAPVLDALSARFGDELEAALRPGRPGHAQLALGVLVGIELARAGLPPARWGLVPDACTSCYPERFHSFRRDGARAGRLIHFVAARQSRGPVA